jgi:hypothetical protein
MDHNAGAVFSTDYRNFITEVTELVWSIQPYFLIDDNLTGLQNTDQGPRLTIAFTARLKPGWPLDAIRADIQREIDLIKSFSNDDSVVQIKKGDSLWRIAKGSFRSGFFYHFLAAANGISAGSVSNVRAGNFIKIPPVYELYPLVGYHFMAPGETLYGLCSKWMPDMWEKCFRTVRKANPHLPLNDLHALDAIRMPEDINIRQGN